jgi:hypothetical protein
VRTPFILFGEILGRSAGTHQIDHLATELTRVSGTGPGRRLSLWPEPDGLHEIGVAPIPVLSPARFRTP